jgi:hypothetical protein
VKGLDESVLHDILRFSGASEQPCHALGDGPHVAPVQELQRQRLPAEGALDELAIRRQFIAWLALQRQNYGVAKSLRFERP